VAPRTRDDIVSVDRAVVVAAPAGAAAPAGTAEDADAADDALAAAVAVRTAAERTRAGRAASPRDALPADRAADVADDEEPSPGVLSAAESPARRTGPREAGADEAEPFADLAESTEGLSSAWAVPAPANATPTPNVRALAPSHAYGWRRRRAERRPAFTEPVTETCCVPCDSINVPFESPLAPEKG
jgi:hypothetical protein